ncbi:MAG: SGNH/GDSL hydrolase family protein [Eubacteriales bacterium]|nr:SGNH/GDSL hydrolase family protein [Eubacteriales bacterium]MCI6971292.1 SGNH/GDSL hydrolase family protein [Eubacterium sp.]MDY5356254.1 SGNH/GDSL hydrolase family protein [Eubacteriales bacterium]
MENLNFCIFGDSVGKGVVLSDTGRYASGSPDINSLTGRDDITLKNYSRFGFVTEKTLWLIEKCGDEIASSDAVFIEVGGNDCDFDWQSISETPDEEHLCKTPPALFEKIYTELLKKAKAFGKKVFALNLPPIVAARYFKNISQRAGVCAENVLKWLGSVETIYRYQEMYSIMVEKIARAVDVALIDIRSAFLSDHHYENFICEDGIHPNSKGYELIYKSVIEQYRAIEQE